MGALRHARSFGNEMSPSPGALGSQQQQQPMSYPLGSTPQGFYVPNVHQGLPTLIVMIVVLMIILLFCFWGAPAVRSFCKQKICCFCPMDEPNMDHVREEELQDYVIVSTSSSKKVKNREVTQPRPQRQQ